MPCTWYMMLLNTHASACFSLRVHTAMRPVSHLPYLLQVKSGMAARDQQSFSSPDNRPLSTATAKRQAQRPESSATQARQTASPNEPTTIKSNGTLAASVQSEPQSATGNGNGGGKSATATVEGSVSENLTTFVTDLDSGPDLPMAPKASMSNAAAPQQRTAQQQQQQTQQPAAGLGTNGVNVEARQAWASARQQGPAGAWQGSGQGPSGGSGGSWTHVDDQMEDARRFLSPWRSVLLVTSYASASLHETQLPLDVKCCLFI